MKALISIAVFVAAFSLARGQANQTCNPKDFCPVHFFETEKVLGTWYGIEYFVGLTEDILPLPYKCLEVNFTRTSDPLQLQGVETYKDLDSDAYQTEVERIVINTDLPIEAVWKIYSSDDSVSSDVVWVHTDNDNWAIQYICQVRDNYRYESFGFWSRERTIDPRTWDILQILANGYGYPPQNGIPIVQIGC